jgi:hypothetical protein
MKKLKVIRMLEHQDLRASPAGRPKRTAHVRACLDGQRSRPSGATQIDNIVQSCSRAPHSALVLGPKCVGPDSLRVRPRASVVCLGPMWKQQQEALSHPSHSFALPLAIVFSAPVSAGSRLSLPPPPITSLFHRFPSLPRHHRLSTLPPSVGGSDGCLFMSTRNLFDYLPIGQCRWIAAWTTKFLPLLALTTSSSTGISSKTGRSRTMSPS